MLKLYAFKSKYSSEIIKKDFFDSKEEAIIYFSEVKKLSLDDFIELFEVFTIKK